MFAVQHDQHRCPDTFHFHGTQNRPTLTDLYYYDHITPIYPDFGDGLQGLPSKIHAIIEVVQRLANDWKRNFQGTVATTINEFLVWFQVLTGLTETPTVCYLTDHLVSRVPFTGRTVDRFHHFNQGVVTEVKILDSRPLARKRFLCGDGHGREKNQATVDERR